MIRASASMSCREQVKLKPPSVQEGTQTIDDYDLTYLAAAPIAAALLAGQDKPDLRGVADAAIRMAEELRDAQSRLDRERHERRIEAENRHFRDTASEATLALHEDLKQQFQTQHDRQVQKDASGKS